MDGEVEMLAHTSLANQLCQTLLAGRCPSCLGDNPRILVADRVAYIEASCSRVLADVIGEDGRRRGVRVAVERIVCIQVADALGRPGEARAAVRQTLEVTAKAAKDGVATALTS